MSAPRVSVLLPMGADRATLGQAVDSLLKQTLDDIEVLLIGHEDVAARLETLPQDPRLRAIPRRAPGIVGALNTGLAHARGRYVARMDDDDVAYPERLAEQLAQHARTPGLVGARVRLVDADGGTDGLADGNRRYAHWLDAQRTPAALRHACLVENPLPHPTWFAERRLFETLGGYRDGDFPEDHDLVLRAWCAGVTLSKPADVLLDWRDHPDRLTRTDPRYRREAFIAMKADIVASPAAGLGLDAGRGVWLAGTGRSARRWCDALLARDVTVRGFVDLDPTRTSKRHRPVLMPDVWLERREADLLIGAVTRPEARAALDRWCRGAGLVSERDYVLGD